MQKTEKNQFSRRRYRALSLMMTGSLLMASTMGSMSVFADDNDTLFGVSLPQVNESNMGYGLNSSGAVSDKLFYSLGGGSVISQPATRSNMQRLGMNLGWSSDLMCGNFDLKTTVGNQLNGVTSGFKNLMGEVIQGATGAVASLPAMIIQRANPGLYEMLTNGVLQGGVAFDKAQLNCQNLSKRMMDMADIADLYYWNTGWGPVRPMQFDGNCGTALFSKGKTYRDLPDIAAQDMRSFYFWRVRKLHRKGSYESFDEILSFGVVFV